jgi:hypothetical protein
MRVARFKNNIKYVLFHADATRKKSPDVWQPAIGYIKNVRYSTEWTLELPITEHLRFTTNITYSVDRGLPQAAPLAAYNWVNGVAWQW